MTALELIADCEAIGVQLSPTDSDGLTIDAPVATLTPALVMRLKNHKAELLEIISAPQPSEAKEQADKEVESFQWETAIDPPAPCPECAGLELWQSMADNWRCLRCDPPTKARRLRKLAARLKIDRTDSPRLSPMGDQ